MASWRDELKPGSFRGVTFETLSVAKTSAQRYAGHKFIGTNAQYAEPEGREPLVFVIEAFVIGDNYQYDKQTLEAALDEVGPGIFVDPFRNRPRPYGDTNDLLTMVQSYTVTEGVTEGLGWAKFSITLEETLYSPYAEKSIQELHDLESSRERSDLVDRFNTSSDLARDGVEVTYGADMAQLTTYAKSAAATVAKVSGKIDEISTAVFGPVAELTRGLGDVADALLDIRDDAAALIRTPQDMAARFVSVFDQIVSITDMDKLLSAAGVTIPQSKSTPADIEADTASVTTARMVDQLALLRFGSLLIETTWAAFDDVIAYRDKYFQLLTQHMEQMTGSEIAQWQDIRSSHALAMDAIAAPLPNLVYVEFNSPISSFEIAQMYYGDRRRADEIVSRNNVVHPGFITGVISLLSE